MLVLEGLLAGVAVGSGRLYVAAKLTSSGLQLSNSAKAW
jgi:hypothetical protein